MTNYMTYLSKLIALAIIGYSFATVWYTISGAMEHYVTHVSLILLLVSIDAAIRSQLAETLKKQRLLLTMALVLAVSVVACGIYFVVQAKALEFSQPFITDTDFAFGCLLIASVLLLTWMVWGGPLAFICLLGALYFAFGHLLPEAVAPNRKYDANLIVSYLAGMGGPRGVLSYAPLSADVIFLLLVFGGALHGTRVIDAFSEVGNSIGNLFRGGVAYSAITASTMIGMVTGQTVSNVALSGSMTIPTMIKSGFRREEAGAIEVLASNGSQLMPPIMGLGAFLMAEILGISYIEVAIAAIVPAVLYMVTCVFGCASLIGASKQIPYERQPVDWRLIRWMLPSFVISFSLLIVLLLMRYSPSLAGFYGLVTLVSLSMLRPAEYRPSFESIISGLHEGALTGAKLALILTAIGIIVQMLVTTGAGLILGRFMIDASSGSIAVGLLIGMAVALFIGMGLPTPAAYALIAIVVIPSLIDLGVPALAANFYGFYFAIFSSLTPPVAVGILTAVRISNGSFMGTAWECLKLGGVCLLLPFLFVAYPNILEFPNLTAQTMLILPAFIVSTIMLSIAIYGATPWGVSVATREKVLMLLSGPAIFLAALFSENLFLKSAVLVSFGVWILLLRRKGKVLAADMELQVSKNR